MKKLLLTAILFLNIHLISLAQYSTVSNKEYASINPKALNYFKDKTPATPHYNYSIDTTEKENNYDFYMAKSRDKNTTAWVFLAGGTVCTAVGLLMFPKDYDAIFGTTKEKDSQATTSSVVSVIGIAAMLTSVPFFISSSINKHKAHVNIDSQKTSFGIPVKAGKKVTGLTLSIGI